MNKSDPSTSRIRLGSLPESLSHEDAALAGCLLTSTRTQDPALCLDRAVAYGTATVLKPSSEVPTPADADAISLTVRKLA